MEFNYGRVKEYTAEELAAEAYVWYDYFGCPQMHRTAPSHELLLRSRSFSENPFQELKAAIASIPYYVSKCDWFIALCPTMSQKDGLCLGSRFLDPARLVHVRKDGQGAVGAWLQTGAHPHGGEPQALNGATGVAILPAILGRGRVYLHEGPAHRVPASSRTCWRTS